MPERRSESRPDAPDRRSFPRPPLWLNLLLLLLGIGGILYGRHHREEVSKTFAEVIAEEARTPGDIRRAKEELAEMDLTRENLEKELEGRMKFVSSLKSENFYLSIDTRTRKLRFLYGDAILREADVTIGESRTVTTPEKTWTFMPVKGAFVVEGKAVDYAWRIPEWMYAMRDEPVPAERPALAGSLGRYVVFLGNGYVIHSPPAPGAPLQGAKPGSYMVPEDVLIAIWPRIQSGKTPVYIY
jgi:hypothetical protein